MKKVKAVQPYDRGTNLNFKMAPYEAWVNLGGEVAKSHYPLRPFHRFAYNFEIPSFDALKSSKETRLRFVEPFSIFFDAYPDYARYEIIPMMWDCWPKYYDRIVHWFKKHGVKTAIISSSTNANAIQRLCPEMNIMYCPEAIDTSSYPEGLPLTERKIDLLEFGRSNKNVIKTELPKNINHICTLINGKYIFTNDELKQALGNTKITIALPCSITDPKFCGGVETMTQRYWESMLSRVIMLGHAPKELTDLIGYNPVIELDFNHVNEQIESILTRIEDYQELADKNRKNALEKGDWSQRIPNIMSFLQNCGYNI